MKKKVKIAFEMRSVKLTTEQILPVQNLKEATRSRAKYATIRASIEEVGIVEPLIVYPSSGTKKKKEYILLDGHKRLDILKSLGIKEVFCLISIDDEGYTYNHWVNRLNPIQEHFMILNAIDNGVSEEKIAKALCVDVRHIRRKRNMIKGLCPEAVELLKDKEVSPTSLALLRKVKPLRQIEIAELMIGLNNFSRNYAQALVIATTESNLVEPEKTKPPAGISGEDLNRMRKEMDALDRDFKIIEESYGLNNLNFILLRGYLTKLLENGRVVRLLSKKHADILAEFNKMVEATSLEHRY